MSSVVRTGAGAAPLSRPERSGLWTSVLRGVVLPAGDALYGQRMMRRLRRLESAQWWEPERLEAARDRAVAELAAVAYRDVPFYRDHLDAAGVDPRSVRTARDLVRVPVVTKVMLRASYPERTTRTTGQRTYEACSSGSTGVNFCVREDMETAGWYRASFLLALEWSGWRIGDPHLQTGMTPERRRERAWKDRILRCRYESAYDLTDEHLDRCLRTIERERLRHVFGYPASLYYLARRAAALGWNLPLRSAVTWGDMLHPHWRREIESAFRTRVFDTYGCGEGFHIAAQCGEGSTYHVHSLDVVVHYVDERGEEVAEGESGNIVVTRLHPGPMPLVRYLLGDAGVRLPARRCACGRGFELMSGIEGRSGDVVVTPSGNRLIVHFFTGILEHFRSIATFQVIQEERDLLRVRVVPGAGFDDSVPAAVAARLRERGIGDMRIEVEVTPSIERPKSNKHRFVLSRLAAEPPRATPAATAHTE